ncbi:hypothetical protein [Spirosoma flavum]|uniref:Uncharacterized protein n=1 Tax=Spirosoma flavum TaxID=2048557 RepID=A0ABW6AQ00_9BACT
MKNDPARPSSWWQTLPGILTAIAATITAITGLVAALNQTGLLPSRNSDNKNSSFPAPTTVNPSPETSNTDKPPINSQKLEQQLADINIKLGSTSKDAEKVRGYFVDTNSSYYVLSAGCLRLLAKRRLKKTGYLDVIDKWYTASVGSENYLNATGDLYVEQLKQALIKAQNDYYGDQINTFDQLIESY